jgi:hypothetical protein
VLCKLLDLRDSTTRGKYKYSDKDRCVPIRIAPRHIPLCNCRFLIFFLSVSERQRLKCQRFSSVHDHVCVFLNSRIDYRWATISLSTNISFWATQIIDVLDRPDSRTSNGERAGLMLSCVADAIRGFGDQDYADLERQPFRHFSNAIGIVDGTTIFIRKPIRGEKKYDSLLQLMNINSSPRQILEREVRTARPVVHRGGRSEAWAHHAS